MGPRKKIGWTEGLRKMINEQALKTFKCADMEKLSGDEDAKKSNGEGVVKVNVFAF
jgi:hypothetical protein